MIEFMFNPNAATTSTNARPDTFSLEDLKKGVEALEAVEDKLAKYMRRHGFDPKSGGVLVLPKTPEYQELIGPFPPKYIRSSAIVLSPTMLKIPRGWNL